MNPCPLCDKIRLIEQLPSDELVWHFPNSVVFLGPWQYHHGYCVVVAREHCRELVDLVDETRRAYLDEMCLTAKAILNVCRPHKLNYELLGNQVPHLHWHLFARQSDDPERLNPVWSALHSAETDEALRTKLQTGPHLRAHTIRLLRDELASLGAPSQ